LRNSRPSSQSISPQPDEGNCQHGLTSRIRGPRLTSQIKLAVKVLRPKRLWNGCGAALDQALGLKERHVLIRRARAPRGRQNVNTAKTREQEKSSASIAQIRVFAPSILVIKGRGETDESLPS